MPPYLSLEMNDDDSTSYARSGTHHGKHAMMLSRDQSVESGGQPVGSTHHD